MKKRSGSALIIALILISVISTAAFAIVRLSAVETNAARNQAANTKAYYLAEGGIEEGLLRWRYNHNATLVPDVPPNTSGSRGATKIWLRREYLTNNSQTVTKQSGDSQLVSNLNSSSLYQASTIYNQVNRAVGDNSASGNALMIKLTNNTLDFTSYIANRPDLLIRKDNKIIFSFGEAVIDANQADDLDLVGSWYRLARDGASEAELLYNQRSLAGRYGIEVRLYQRTATGDDLLAKKVFSPTDPSHRISGSRTVANNSYFRLLGIKAFMNVSAFQEGETYLTITPLNADIIIAAFARKNVGGSMLDGGEIGDSVSHIESVGIADGRMRGLNVKINQNRGQILGLYDYAIYEGN